MDEQNTQANAASRRGFLKALLLGAGASLIAPVLAACSPQQKDEYEVDIVIDQSTIKYSPATLRIPQGATVTWLNNSYYSQSATCDPGRVAKGGAVSLPPGAQPWNSGILFPGQRYSRRFDRPGTYVYSSVPLLSTSTVGTIIVE